MASLGEPAASRLAWGQQKSFNKLLAALREAHEAEVQSLRLEVSNLKGQLSSDQAGVCENDAKEVMNGTGHASSSQFQTRKYSISEMEDITPPPHSVSLPHSQPEPIEPAAWGNSAMDSEVASNAEGVNASRESRKKSVRMSDDVDKVDFAQPDEELEGEKRPKKLSSLKLKRGFTSDVKTVTASLKTSFENVMPEEEEEVVMPFQVGGARKSLVMRKSRQESRFLIVRAIEDLVYSAVFETFFGGLIMANAIVMAAESQFHGLQLASSMQHASSSNFPDSMWEGAPLAFDISNYLFGVVFLLEVVLKMIGQRARFVVYIWNWIDLAIVALWVVSCFQRTMDIDPNIIRLARLGRLVRLVRLAHNVQEFDALYLISSTLASSTAILAWASVLFIILQMTLALFVTNFLTETYLSGEQGLINQGQQDIFTLFGTFTRSMFTMFELTLGNWGPIARLLSEEVSEWWMVFSVIHKLTIGFAFVSVVNGVFLQETFKVAATDDRVMLKQKKRVNDTHRKKMELFFKQADRSGDGHIDIMEFSSFVSNPSVALWLSSMEMDEKDSDLLFHLIDVDGDGQITLPELVESVSRLKGGARSLDLLKLVASFKYLEKRVSYLIDLSEEEEEAKKK